MNNMPYDSWLEDIGEQLASQGLDYSNFEPEELEELYNDDLSPQAAADHLAATSIPSMDADDYAEPAYDAMGRKIDWNEERLEDEVGARSVGSGRPFESFDRFMDDILIKESKQPQIKTENDSAQRKRAARYQDRPGNKTRIGGR